MSISSMYCFRLDLMGRSCFHGDGERNGPILIITQCKLMSRDAQNLSTNLNDMFPSFVLAYLFNLVDGS